MKLEDYVMANRIVTLLNELIELDKPAVAALIANRVPCSESMALHPTVQVATQHGGFHVGWLGVLNGLCGHDVTGPIVAVFQENPENTGGNDLEKFVIWDGGRPIAE